MSIGPSLYLGRVGSTGTSTGPHAHWEVLKDGKRFPLSKARSDIGQYLQFRLPKQESWQTLYSKQGDNFVLNPAAALTSPMGMRKHPVHGDMREHRGEDYALPEGTQLRFLGPGSVATHRNQGGAGNVSSLRTGPYELQTLHLSELPEASIAKGERPSTGTAQEPSGDFQGLLSGYLLGSLLRGEPKEDLKTQMMRGFVKELVQPQQNDMAGALFQQLLSSSTGGLFG